MVNPALGGMGLDWIGFGYAALVTSGGIIGYAKAGSVPSLAAGLLFGSLAGWVLTTVSESKKRVAFSDCIWNTDWSYGMRFYTLEKSCLLD
ncbi:transmembrane protein 14C-like [Dermochelys coriacea]|uniref:transmembrane protein 14C-like n=1 Tax=Dermochelys coriacea TaxID=27794 RepID=UPI0018E7C010|nr:transmembrane protein 14C-like [Dermochelys coriacea]